MKKTTLVTTLALLTTSLSFAGGEGWMHDFEAAKKKAAAENKDLLVDFTGSDWCGWCIKLVDEVFQHDAFKTGIADNYILVELDYPKDKSKLDEATIAQNEELKKSYAIKGYPSIFLMDAQGRPYAQTGYQKGGPEAYVKHLAELQEKKTSRDEALATAEKATGVDKAKALAAALENIPEGQASHYGTLSEDIIKNDPEDVTGFAAAKEKKEAMANLQKEIQSSLKADEAPKALAAVEQFITTYKLEGEEKQQITSIKVNILMRSKDYDGASAVLDEIIAIDPESPSAQAAAGFKPRLEAMKAKAAEKE